MAVHADQLVARGEVLVEADVHAVAHADAVAAVGQDLVAPEQVVAALVEGDAVGMVAVDLVVGHQVALAVTVEDDPGKLVLVAAVVEDEAVVDFPRDDDAVLLPGPVDGVVGDDQAVRTVVRVDAVDDVVAVGVALHHQVVGLVAIEAVPAVDDGRVDHPALGARALHLLVHARAVLRDGDAVGLGGVVAEAGEGAVAQVHLGAAPGDQERTELVGRLEPGRLLLRFAPAGDLAVADEQHAVVDQERAALLGQAQFLDLLVDVEGRALADHDRQAGDEHPRLDLFQRAGGKLAGELGEVHVAAFDEDRLGHLALALDPFGEAVAATGELLQRLLLDHALHAGAATRLAHDLGFHRGGGVAGEVGQFRRVQVQRFGRRGGHRVVAGFLQALGQARLVAGLRRDRLRFLHRLRRPRLAVQQHRAEHCRGQRAQAREPAAGDRKGNVGHVRFPRGAQKRQMKSTKARCMVESVPGP